MKFYKNNGKRCAQTIIKSLMSNKYNLDINFLDAVSGRKEEEITSPIQISYCLSKLGIKFFYPVKNCFSEISLKELKEKTLNYFGKNNFLRCNFTSILKSLNYLRDKKDYLKRENFQFQNLIEHMKNGKVPICLINLDVLVNRKNKKRGHYLLIKSIKEDYLWVYDCGPYKADYNKKIKKNNLERALMETPLDYGIIFVDTQNL